jgi:hypothetical protein
MSSPSDLRKITNKSEWAEASGTPFRRKEISNHHDRFQRQIVSLLRNVADRTLQGFQAFSTAWHYEDSAPGGNNVTGQELHYVLDIAVSLEHRFEYWYLPGNDRISHAMASIRTPLAVNV